LIVFWSNLYLWVFMGVSRNITLTFALKGQDSSSMDGVHRKTLRL